MNDKSRIRRSGFSLRLFHVAVGVQFPETHFPVEVQGDVVSLHNLQVSVPDALFLCF